MLDTENCEYWQLPHHKHRFLTSVRNQILDGDCFELIDSRTLEMRTDILNEIVGDIAHKKCVVVSVIGP